MNALLQLYQILEYFNSISQRKTKIMGVSLRGVTYFSHFQKLSILKIPQHCQCCVDCVQFLYSGRYEVVLPVKFYFVKIGAVLSDILGSQKCIKWGWCIH